MHLDIKSENIRTQFIYISVEPVEKKRKYKINFTNPTKITNPMPI